MKKYIQGKFEDLKKYLKAVRSELKKVTWPTKDELKASTIVVAVAVIVVSFYMWLIDNGLAILFRFIQKKF